MTREELEKEAEEKADIYFNSLEVDNGNVSDTRFSDYDVFIAYEKGALDFAEPREKRITELEKENAEFKETVIKMNNVITETFSNLTKAKSIIEDLYKDLHHAFIHYEKLMHHKKMFEDLHKAEQFLEEIKEK